MADLVSVTLAVATGRAGQVLEVTFEAADTITPEGRNLMTGYNLRGKVGKCDLIVEWLAYPDAVGLGAGSGDMQCGAAGREIATAFRIQGNKVTVGVPLRDLKSVALGDQMTALKAHTALGQGLADDDYGALALTGDSASSDKSWTLGPA